MKLLAHIKESPSFEEFIEKLKEIDKRHDERMKFISTQADNSFSKLRKEQEEIWKPIEEVLKQMGRLPNDFTWNENMAVSVNESGILLGTKSEGSFTSMLASLFGPHFGENK